MMTTSARVTSPRNASPRVVLVQDETPFTTSAAREFHDLGWGVIMAAGGAEARRLVIEQNPDLVVIPADQFDESGESGWLTCAKLRLGMSYRHVLLVEQDVNPTSQQLAWFVGAAGVFGRETGVSDLIDRARRLTRVSPTNTPRC